MNFHCVGIVSGVSNKVLLVIIALALLSSCSVIEKSSMHGFNDGYYRLMSGDTARQVYIGVSDEKIAVYPIQNKNVLKEEMMVFPQEESSTIIKDPAVFKNTSLDIDITSVLLKYRLNNHPIPSELSAELNVALYVGPRFDRYAVKNTTDPVGNRHYKVSHRGFDFGALAGIGTTTINPFSTQNAVADEYNGMFVQAGVAGFLETSFASFGLSVGMDYLMTADKNDWIYQNKPWVGFVVGIALN